MPPTETSILERIIESETAELSSEVARYLLALDFSPGDRLQMEALQAKANEGALSAPEQIDLDEYRRVAQLINRLHVRAHRFMAATGASVEANPPERTFVIPPGIRCSQEALRRDLLRLLKNRRQRGK